MVSCRAVFQRLSLPPPVSMNLSGYGQLISSGLTNTNLRVNEDAFLPGRNLLFLLAGCAYASEKKANSVAIGLLTEKHRLFPDQTADFLRQAESLICSILFHRPKIVAPLIDFSKSQVLVLARKLGIDGTYSCHSGTVTPCGVCVSCLETAHAPE